MPSQPRIDTQQIDSRQRRELVHDRRGAVPQIDPAQPPPEGETTFREPVPRALDANDDNRSPYALGAVQSRSDELLALSPAEFKVVENRLRRMADRQDLQLVKSRRRDRHAPAHGKYMLVDRSASAVPAGGNWSLDLGEVEHILLATSPAARRLSARNCPKCATPTHSLSGLISGALIDDRECPDCGHSFIADPNPTDSSDASAPTAGFDRRRRQ